jgi:putative glutamine amidotransferase
MAGGAMEVMVPAVSTGSTGSTVLASDNALDYYAAALEGLALLGGNDVDPQHYGEDPLHEDWGGDRVRDQYEMALIRAFVAAGKPVLAQRASPKRPLLNTCSWPGV